MGKRICLTDLLLVCITLSIVSRRANGAVIASTCQKINACSCKTSTHIIDLSPIANNGGTFRFSARGSGSESPYTYYWNPCKPFTYPTNAHIGLQGRCTDVALCVSNKTFYDNIGTQASAEFVIYPPQTATVIQYRYRPSGTPSTIKSGSVSLQCDSQTPGKLSAIEESKTGVFVFVYKGKYACPLRITSHAGLSVGSILLIVFFSLVGAYLLFGVMYMRVMENQRGIRLIPNYDTWDSLISDTKGGVMFVVTCGKDAPAAVTSQKYDSM